MRIYWLILSSRVVALGDIQLAMLPFVPTAVRAAGDGALKPLLLPSAKPCGSTGHTGGRVFMSPTGQLKEQTGKPWQAGHRLRKVKKKEYASIYIS